MTAEYLNVEGVADRYPGQTPWALYAQRKRGEAPGALGVKVGRRLLWRTSDLEAWFDEQLATQRERVAG